MLVGAPQSITDDFAHWFNTGACDGFNEMFSSSPQGLDDFVTLVVSELQQRGLVRTAAAYEYQTLRENLDLPRIENLFFPRASLT